MKPSRGQNCYLSMRSKNWDWLCYKATQLQQMASEKPMTAEKTYRWHSKCYPIFNGFREKFYKDGKRHLMLEKLDLLRDTAWAVWFGDCGRYDKGKVILNTHVWGKEGTEIISEYFGYCNYDTKPIQERKNYRIQFDDDSSYNFMKITENQLPVFMLRAIPIHTPN